MKTKISLLFSVLGFMSTTLLNAQSAAIPGSLDKKKTDDTENLKAMSQTSVSASQKTVAKTKTLPNDHTAVNYNVKANTQALQELQKQSEELSSLSQKLRSESKDKHESVKKILLSEANNLDRQTQLVQVAASELSAEISYYKYDANKSNIKKYVTKNGGEQNVPQYTKNLIFDSEKIIRLAKEMREEANAQPSIAAKLGTMGNAEEQEALALSKQVEALNQLEKATYTLTAR